jgi:DNA modification methylase
MNGVETQHRVIFNSATDLSALPDDSIDLIVTSPPYPMIQMWDEQFATANAAIAEALDPARLAGDRGEGAFNGMHEYLAAVWRECARVLRPQRFVCINVGDATRTIGGEFRLFQNHPQVVIAWESLGFVSLPPILWRKTTNSPTKFMGSGMLPAGAYVTLEHEYILVFRNGGKRRFTPEESERRRRSAFFWEERNLWFSDLWDLQGTRQRLNDSEITPLRRRSAAFPYELAFRLINMYSIEGDTVLDPFLGTGTTTAAAIGSGRNSVGIERDPALAQAIGTTIDSAPKVGVQRQRDRLAAHTEFVAMTETNGTRRFKHRNRFYDIPVMTSQETDIILPAPGTIEDAGDNPVEGHLGLSETKFELSVPTGFFR